MSEVDESLKMLLGDIRDDVHEIRKKTEATYDTLHVVGPGGTPPVIQRITHLETVNATRQDLEEKHAESRRHWSRLIVGTWIGLAAVGMYNYFTGGGSQ